MDWLDRALLFFGSLMAMKPSPEELNTKAWTPGVFSALVMTSAYHGKLMVTGDLTPRWIAGASP